jgi:hypothetical protein
MPTLVASAQIAVRGDAERGENAAAPAAEQRVADGQRGVGSGRRDDEDRDARKRQEMIAHVGQRRVRREGMSRRPGGWPCPSARA